MADIDVGALKQFQTQWGPVLAAIPAVLDMVERKADLDRAMAKYEQDVEDIRNSGAKLQAQADAKLANAQAELDGLQERKLGWLQDLADFRAAADAERTATEQAAAAAVADAQARVAEATAQAAGLEAEYAAKKKEAETAHSALLAAQQAEIDALDATRVKAEKALEAIRAKLG